MSDLKKRLDALKDNTELLREIVTACNSVDGSLEDYDVRDFDDDFFSTYFDGNPEEAARATFFGDIQSWMDDYIRFNGYGNLESLNSYQLERELEGGYDEIATEALRLADEIDLNEILERYE